MGTLLSRHLRHELISSCSSRATPSPDPPFPAAQTSYRCDFVLPCGFVSLGVSVASCPFPDATAQRHPCLAASLPFASSLGFSGPLGLVASPPPPRHCHLSPTKRVDSSLCALGLRPVPPPPSPPRSIQHGLHPAEATPPSVVNPRRSDASQMDVLYEVLLPDKTDRDPYDQCGYTAHGRGVTPFRRVNPGQGATR